MASSGPSARDRDDILGTPSQVRPQTRTESSHRLAVQPIQAQSAATPNTITPWARRGTRFAAAPVVMEDRCFEMTGGESGHLVACLVGAHPPADA